MNDMTLESEDTELDMYADDSTEYATDKTLEIPEEKLEKLTET